MSQTLTIRVDDAARLEAVDRLARSMDRSRNWVINRAIERYLAEQAWQIEAIQHGLAEADRGDFASSDAVVAALAGFGKRDGAGG